jgi:hypothetical protein
MALGCSNLNSSAWRVEGRTFWNSPRALSADDACAIGASLVLVGGQVDHLAADEGLDAHALQVQPGHARGKRVVDNLVALGDGGAGDRVEHVGIERAVS